MASRKKKILLLSDHALCTSGVGVQSRHLIEGLLKLYPGEWSFRQFGAAIQHANYDTVQVNEDFVIKPINGFGTPELLRVTLATEKPDMLMLFTDPRFFIWLFEMEDEIHQMCPISWWHVWDNRPTPQYNDVLYRSTDLLNCHSYLTYEMCSENHPEKTNFIPHSIPQEIFFPHDPTTIKKLRNDILGPHRKDHFIVSWVNRNARRKRPADLLQAWSIFKEYLMRNNKFSDMPATLIMHTDPTDQEGPNLLTVADSFGIRDDVIFSTERVDFTHMNDLYNMSDCVINISYAEGFGLSTLEAMQTATPIIALKTGGLTRQVVDHRTGEENGIALPVEFQTLVGSQQVPYIYEDYVSAQTIADAFITLYEKTPQERHSIGLKAREYVMSEFNYESTIDRWHETLTDTIDKWKKTYKRWDCTTI